ncbi:acetolactate synthase large subunit [Methylocapsa acidiphila]|uniref:acetolactate synthase large subunit n=1 Tax=Methylocapsa acidiphila TaxID=133552 RepID=UPI00041C364E|nr:acetolactate synthase large subunit [Methylocapsa acidiphila]
MNGAESLVRTLTAGGVEVCFANPGTSEMHFVAALDRVAGMRCILGLFEGVVTGAADGYGRMARKPACSLLHLGPGLANGLANLHNARRARAPLINIVGEHATRHKRYDAPLTTDIEAIARPYSDWLRISAHAADLGSDAADAIVAARSEPGRIATLILPADVAWTEGGAVAALPPIPSPPMPASATIDRAAAMLRADLPTAILLAGNALLEPALTAAGRVAEASGARLLAAYSMARIERGAGRPIVTRVPYVLEQAAALLREFRQLILVGAGPPVAFFAYPDKSSALTPEGCETHVLARPGEDCAAALDALATILGASPILRRVQDFDRPAAPSGEITLPGLAAVVAALLPENCVVVDESMTSGRGMLAATKGAPPHDWLCNTGGSIGIAMPMAVGAAVARPDRSVLCLSADGSGMFTLQALWTMARENLAITTVVFANRAYAILKGEYANLGGGPLGPSATSMLEIGRPELDWTALAKGMGVPGVRVESLEAFAKALDAGLRSQGPYLIEVPL